MSLTHLLLGPSSSGWVALSSSGVRAFAFFIVFCFVAFRCCLFEACSFLVGDGRGVDPREWGGWGSWEDWREGKLVRMYCMREKSISSFKKKRKKAGLERWFSD